MAGVGCQDTDLMKRSSAAGLRKITIQDRDAVGYTVCNAESGDWAEQTKAKVPSMPLHQVVSFFAVLHKLPFMLVLDESIQFNMRVTKHVFWSVIGQGWGR